MRKVDILLATYNGQKFIEEQIVSIQNQTHTDWRLLIRDDFSTDNTRKIIKRLSEKDTRILLINDDKGNLGVIKNFEILLSYSDADYIMLCDQDDYWLPFKVEKTLGKMLETEIEYLDLSVMVHTDVSLTNENLEILSESFYEKNKFFEYPDLTFQLSVQNRIIGCTVMINKVSKKYIFPFGNYTLMHDWWMALIISHYGKIAYLNIPTMLYRQHVSNQVGSKELDKEYYKNKFFRIGRMMKLNRCYVMMLNELPFKLPILKILFCKLKMSFNRFLIQVK